MGSIECCDFLTRVKTSTETFQNRYSRQIAPETLHVTAINHKSLPLRQASHLHCTRTLQDKYNLAEFQLIKSPPTTDVCYLL